jgi:hypothetical protein
VAVAEQRGPLARRVKEVTRREFECTSIIVFVWSALTWTFQPALKPIVRLLSRIR